MDHLIERTAQHSIQMNEGSLQHGIDARGGVEVESGVKEGNQEVEEESKLETSMVEYEKTEATVENEEVETSAMKTDWTDMRRSTRVNRKPEWLRGYVSK